MNMDDLTDDELENLFYRVEHAAGDTRAGRRALYEAGKAAALASRVEVNVPPNRIFVKWWGRGHVTVSLKPFAILDGARGVYLREGAATGWEGTEK
jgi:hypothetical protein